MRIIDNKEKWARRRKIARQPIQTMHNRKRPIGCRRFDAAADEEGPHGGGGATDQRVAILLRSTNHASLEQLTHHTKREFDFELRTARPERLIAKFLRAAACGIDQRRLPETDASLDQEDSTGPLEQSLNRGQLTQSFKQWHPSSLVEYAAGRQACWD